MFDSVEEIWRTSKKKLFEIFYLYCFEINVDLDD